MKRLFIFSEESIPGNPQLSSGATTRLTARIAEYLRKNKAIEIVYANIYSEKEHLSFQRNIIKDPQKFISDFHISNGDVGIFIRYNFEESLPVLKEFKSAGGITIAHLSDPHVENPAPEMQSRVMLHTQMLSEAHGIIATSEELRKIGSRYNVRTVHIPDVIDFPSRLSPRSWFQEKYRQHQSILLLSSGYPLHHRSFRRAVENVKKYAEDSQVRIDYHIVTAPVKPTEIATHGDYFQELALLAGHSSLESCFRLYIHAPFRPEVMEWLLELADIYVIPGFSNEFLSDFQQYWFPKKGVIRITQGLAAGIPVLLTREYPESYQSFLHANSAVVSAATVSDGIKDLLAIPAESLLQRITHTQDTLYSQYGVNVIAEAYWEFIKDVYTNERI
ncbi:hypothetical protein QNI16_27090 [Cytophagaceae bacterium YF14B1]|uniref:Glycosyltransferase n=1 Tax=Xanthocytophaga flava TaxID=3048013 RepID=A0AAE3QWQ7_9BACT|nr:hypothetical protein [Xanthocytophaga flavus]MDJ1484194.1 hypothetical protein [Xanthocytophaga flavus]